MTKPKEWKGWAIVTRSGAYIVGGGLANFGYTPLMIFSTKVGAKEYITPTRNDKIIPVKITALKPKKV